MPTTRSNWRTGTTRRTSNTWNPSGRFGYSNSSTSSSYGARSNWTPTTYSPNKYNTYRTEITAKIQSYRAINQQFTGSGMVTAFSPSTCNKWINYVNDGCNVYTFTNQQFSRYFGTQWSNNAPTSAFRYLRNKYGTGIKAVTRGKGNCWLVAATPKVTARPFSGYSWK
ncbi:MAG: hypothetical protein HZB38_17935 [Planctomycetes bacterium]|nr:hypothetical protein [Planctomycetota bacterium]